MNFLNDNELLIVEQLTLSIRFVKMQVDVDGLKIVKAKYNGTNVNYHKSMLQIKYSLAML